MQFISICLFFLFVFSETKSEIQIQRCVDNKATVIEFRCEEQILFGYSCENSFHASFKCGDSKKNFFDLNPNVLKEYPNVNELFIAYLGIKHLNVNGIFYSDTITYFVASFNQLSNIPSSISMSNLERLDLSNNNFKSLTSGNFQSDRKMITFCSSIFSSPLEKGLSLNCPQLEILDLGINQIATIEDFSFQKFNRLNYLRLAYNQLTQLRENTFYGVPELTHLSLSNNRIKDIHLESFATLKNLQEIYLESNQIETIDENLFVNNNRLRCVGLQDNPLRRFSYSAFPPPSKLYFPLDKIFNDITGLSPSCTNSTDAYLDKPGVRSAHISKVTSKLNENLESLDLNNCSMETLNSDVLKWFAKLEELRLKNTKVFEIKPDAFKSCQGSLRQMDLSDNQLRSIVQLSECGPFDALEELHLNQNELNTITGQFSDT